MASPEDVIELGSSDEEAQPTPKKRKVVPNAMVRIPPTKIPPGVSIRPTINKAKINPIQIAKGTIGKGVTVTKVSSSNLISNPFANKNKVNGKPIVKPKQFNPIQIIKNSALPIINNPALKVTRHHTNLPIITNSKPIPFTKVMSTISLAKTSNILPPGITIKKTSQLSQSGIKCNMRPNPVNMQGRLQARPTHSSKSKPNEVFCVDDDETPPSSSGPQWYLRPEEQESKTPASTKKSNDSPKKSSDDDVENEFNKSKEKVDGTIELEKEMTDLEQQNNKEPESNFIEITIEDSPAKIQNKRTSHVADLAITIDDSPVKGIADKTTAKGSDDEATTNNEKHSKKKLEYPKSDQASEAVEIEIELTPVENTDSQNDDKQTDSQDDVVGTEILLVDESPVKPAEQIHTSTPKKIHPKPQLKLKKAKPALIQPAQSLEPKETDEFHPVYQKFIDLCFQLENSEDMGKIVEKKIKAYYRQVPKEYTESEAFADMVASKISAMKAGPEKMYLYIKDVVDELNLQRKIAKSRPVKLDTINEEQEKILYGEESQFDSKHQRQIRKLEKTLKKLHRAIQKLEEQEVDFDDEEDSVYLLTERYKERMIRVHAKFCQLTNTKMPSEPRVQIDARPGQPKGPAKRLEKWINKKVPIGTPLPFPDFHDVIRCVRDANEEDKLGWNEADIMEEARDLFTRCGKKLQRRRQENEWRLAASRIQQDVDPAVGNEDLKKKLEENRQVASQKESEVLNKFADRQKQLNLEVAEIGDQEADESPVESDDEEPTEESISLETKEKRKERLKRLLQEKSKKASDAKVNKSNIENQRQSNVEIEKVENTEATGTKYTVEKEVKETREEEFKETLEKGIKEPGEEDPKESVEKELKRAAKTIKTGAKDHSKKANDEESSPMEFENTVRNCPLDEHKKGSRKKSDSEKIHSLSDDSDKIDSDIDELHLLQKLHSDEINSSTLESSDSESAIAISDTLSSSDNKKQASDVISIENSSYSESENRNDEQEYDLQFHSKNKIFTETVNVEMEIECSNAGVEKNINKSNNDEYNESVEDILLASSDEEVNDVEEDAQNAVTKEMNANTTELNEEVQNKNTVKKVNASKHSEELTSVTHVEPNELNANNVTEITSITSTDTSDNAAEVTSISSTDTVEKTKNNEKNDNTAEITYTSKSSQSVEDVIMNNLDGETVDNLNVANSVISGETTAHEVTEISSMDNADNIKATNSTTEKSKCSEATGVKSVETSEREVLEIPAKNNADNIEATESPKLSETFGVKSVVTTENEVLKTPAKDINKITSNEQESNKIPNNNKDSADVRVEECAEKKLKDLPAPEPMEIDDKM